jgi:serine/threonine protein phosphatase PrpC
MKFSVFQVSRKGGRAQNEDRMGYCYTRDAAVFILADGMGGHPEGEVAAQLALRTVADLFLEKAQPELPDVAVFLSEALLAAHRQILQYGTSRGMLDCPRTTIVIAVVQAGQVSWTHCGDSRFYLLRSGALVTRTRDHSLIEQNLMRPPEARITKRLNRNVLFTCLGSPARPMFKPEGPVSLQQGDRVMLCSDGLWSTVAEKDIVLELSHKPVAAAVPDLVESALRQGGAASDNVTCVALEWETPDGFDTTQGALPSLGATLATAFPTTLFADMPDTAADEFDDAAIERSIEEINAAIRRSAARKR